MSEQPNGPDSATEKADQNLLTNIIMACLAPAIACVVFGGVFFYQGWQELNRSGPHQHAWGDFGSYLQGTTGSLWALASVFIIFVAFLMQLRQLKEQREQFRLQSESIKRQNFESSFFQLLNLQNEISSQIRRRVLSISGNYINPNPTELQGRDCFEQFYALLKQECNKPEDTKLLSKFISESVSNMEADLLSVAKAYLRTYTAHQKDLSHYFRNLYHVFKFVKAADVPDKRRYTSLARAQLSQFELALLFYNALTPIPPESENKFKPLIEEFGLLENLDRNLLLNPSHEKMYAAGAYQ